jgi:hypothetical protein
VVVNGTRDVVGLGNVGSGVVTVFTTDVVVTVFTTDVVVAFAIVVVGRIPPPIAGSGVVTVFGAVVAGKVVKLRAAFF